MPSIPSDQAFEKTYNSLSGVDIKAVFHNKAVVPLQAISYAVQREKAPIYTMGHPDPRAFSRGKRGIAGTLIFAVFDTHPLVGVGQGIFKDARFYADREEVRASTAGNVGDDVDNIFNLEGGAGTAVEDLIGETTPATVADDVQLSAPWYSDQIPPFDVTLTGANELGTVMVMRVVGVEILNEGYGISIDDLMSEKQMTYVARAIIPWTRFRGGGTDSGIKLS